MPFIRKILFYATFALPLMCLALTSKPVHGNSSGPTTVKLQLFWHHQFEFAGFYAAISQGYFDKYNINVELVKFDPTLDTTDLVLAKKAQFGLAGTEIIESFHHGKDVMLLASYFKRSPLIIITQPEILSLKQLTNNKVYGRNQQLKQGSIREMLNLFDVDSTKIITTDKGDLTTLFENKEIAGVFAYRTNLPYQFNQKKIKYRIFDPNQFGIASQDLNLFTTGTFAKENSELVKNFTLAANEGWDYAVKHPKEIIELIKAQYNIQNLTTNALKFEANETIKLISPELFDVGSIQKNKLVTISEDSFANKSIASIKNLDDFIFELNPKQKIDSGLLKSLTLEENKYLNEHPVIRVQNDDDYPPFNYLVDGKPSGYSVDLINLIASMLGIKVELITGKSWIEYKEMLKRKELDVLLNIIDLESKHDFIGFTSPYAGISTYAVSRTNEFSSVVTINSLTEKRIAITQGYAINKSLKKALPNSIFIPVKDTFEALQLISANQADVYFEAGAVLDYYMTRNSMSNLQLLPAYSELNVIHQDFSIVTHKENKTLLNVLQKTMDAIPDIEQIRLKRKWFNEINNNNKNILKLTQQEKKYLVNNPIIRVQNDGNYPPFNYLIKGKPSGYSVDLMNKISILLGVKVEYETNKEWSEYLTMLEKNDLDMMINIVDTKSRQSFARFTSPYAEIATMAVIRQNESNSILTKEALLNKRIAISIGYAVNESIKRAFPDNNFIEAKDTYDALQLISLNKADVYFEAGSVVDYYITKNFMTELQVVSVTPNFGFTNQNFSLATNKDNTVFLEILQKALNAIPEIEQIELRRKWFGHYETSGNANQSFTQEELKFIAQTPVTLCRPDLDQGSGASKIISLIDLITKDTGLNIKMSRPLIWADSLSALQNKECDLLLEVTNTAKRRKSFNFTPTYFRDALTIVTKKEKKTISDIFDHLPKQFGILRGSSSIALLKKHYPEIKLKEVSTSIDGIELVKQDHIFGYIYSSQFAKSLFKENNLTNLKMNAPLRNKFDDLQAIATRKGDDILHSILSKALANTDKKEIIKIIQQSYLDDNKAAINLSNDEKTLLKSKEIIWCVSSDSKSWEELIPYIADLVEMNMVKSKVYSWGEALQNLENGTCDFLPEVTPTESRKNIMSFTPSVHKEERVIVTMEDHKFISNIEDYLDQTFATVKGDLITEQLRKSYPNIKLETVEHELDGLQSVQNGQSFGYIASISLMSNTINQYALKNLKISGSLPDKFMDDWTIATRKDDVLLNSIFSKVILAVDKKELRKRLFGQYSVKYEQSFDYTLFWKMLFVALIILAAIILWNRRLAALNYQLNLAKKVAEEAQQKVESQNNEILATQQQLVQSEKMASLGTLTAGVAHEINNPTCFTYAAVYMMQSEIDEIKNFLKLLAGGDDADVEVINSFDKKFEKLIKLAKTACEGTNRIKVIVEDLRTFARLDDAKQARTHVSELIISTIHLVQTQYENIIMNTEFKYDPVLKCFPSKLNQVFMNIIVNACQSIITKLKQNHQLNSNNKEVGMINITTSMNNNYLVVHIKDNGCGMDKLTQQKVCDPFFTTKDVGSGTGLGMAISFGIIEEHDGILKISSCLTEGSEFSVHLPVEVESPGKKHKEI